VTLIVNALAGTTLLGGRTTGEVSDLYANLFTPAGYVFGIWGIIYALLAVFVIYQALPNQQSKPFQAKIGALFILSSIFNVVWLFLWQYDYSQFHGGYDCFVGYINRDLSPLRHRQNQSNHSRASMHTFAFQRISRLDNGGNNS
jgi:tryptophan-rich sensory protein